jgi:hypothetical protein
MDADGDNANPPVKLPRRVQDVQALGRKDVKQYGIDRPPEVTA